jgi:hypothetical protein
MFEPLVNIGISKESRNVKVRIEKILELFTKSFIPDAIQIPRTAKETVANTVIFGREMGS